MKTEKQLLEKLEQNVLELERLDAKYPEAKDMSAEDVEKQMGAVISVVILAWVMDMEEEVHTSITIARAKAALAGKEVG